MSRYIRRRGGFVTSVIGNLLLNGGWLLIPIALLVMHYVIDDFPIWPFWLVLVLYILIIVGLTFFMAFLIKVGNEPEPERENKNPYSVGQNKNPYSKKGPYNNG